MGTTATTPTPPMTEEEMQKMIDEVFAEQGVGGQGAGTPAPASEKTAFLDLLIAQKGKPIHSGPAPKKTSSLTGGILPGQEKVTRYLWADKTYVDIDDATGVPQGGTAMATAKEQKESPLQKFQDAAGQWWNWNPKDGKVTQMEGPATKPAPAPKTPTPLTGVTGKQPQFGVIMPDGTPKFYDDPNYNSEENIIERANRIMKLSMDVYKQLLDDQKYTEEQLEKAAADQYKRLELEMNIEDRQLDREKEARGSAERLAIAGANTAMSALPYLIPKGATANIDKNIGALMGSAGLKYEPTPAQPFPYGDPMQIVNTMANSIAQEQAARYSPQARAEMGLPEQQNFKLPPAAARAPIDTGALRQQVEQQVQAAIAQQMASAPPGQGNGPPMAEPGPAATPTEPWDNYYIPGREGVGFRAPTLEEIQAAGPNSAQWGAPW